MNFFTLSFLPEQEKLFRIENYSKSVKQIRLALIAGFFLYAIFGLLDYYLVKQKLYTVWFIRYAVACPVLIISIISTYSPRLKLYLSEILGLIVLIVSLGIVAITSFISAPASYYYYAGLILITQFYNVIQIRFIYALSISIVVLFSYEAIAIFVSKDPKIILLSNNFFLLSSYSLGIFTSYIIELYIRKEFIQNKLLEIERANLKTTQLQLIQSEKMASLGEVTAGIAHEIQNPLNFVNNFSEINNELIDEMNEELNNGNFDDAKIISYQIKQNLEKINHHGKRADSIVKGMLQHTRASSGHKELTDINKLADEYLKHAYNAVRSRDKSFNAALITNYDESVGSINIVAQDIARVLLNIYNNAFYAVNEKAKQSLVNYEPAITVTTKKLNDKIEISIRDNGNGIPQKVIDKIFQPFFTTKPTGQGTGLGLSLSYDIIKAHGGEIKVNTKEGEFTEFVLII